MGWQPCCCGPDVCCSGFTLPTTVSGIITTTCSCTAWNGKTFGPLTFGGTKPTGAPAGCTGWASGGWDITQTWCVQSTQQVTYSYFLYCNNPAAACTPGVSGWHLYRDVVRLSPFLGACFLGGELAGEGDALVSFTCNPFQVVFSGQMKDALGWCSCINTSYTITIN